MGDSTRQRVLARWMGRLCLAAAALGSLAGCGGGGGGDKDDDNPASPTYSIGGTLSGLSGSVTLRNGSETLTRSANGAFTFSGELEEGDSYSVSVATQPSGQTCAVANGSGTVGKADVSNVSVTCSNLPASSYLLGGTLSGATSAVVLQNGTESLTVDADGAFSFSTPLLTGTTYAVTVGTQPLAQTCTVTNGSGTMATAAVVNIEVTCTDNPSPLAGRRWQPATQVFSSTANIRWFSHEPGLDVGLADDGAATVVFMQADSVGGREALRMAQGQPGAGTAAPVWSTPVVIDAAAPVESLSYRPRLSVSPNGNAVVTWVSSQLCGTEGYGLPTQNCLFVYASRRLVGDTGWEAPVRVQTSNMTFGTAVPRINDRGDIAVLFHGMPTRTPALDAQRAAVALRTAAESSFRIQMFDGLPLGDLLTVNDRIDIALDAASRVTVVGEVPNASATRDIVAYRGTVAGGFGTTPTAEILDSRSASATFLGALTGLEGEVAVLWNQQTGTASTGTLISVFSPVSGSWVQTDLTPQVGNLSTRSWALRIPDGSDGSTGTILVYRGCSVVRRLNGVWQPLDSLPTDCGMTSGGILAMDRNGNFIETASSGGLWRAYDAQSNTMVKTQPTGTAVANDYVLGVAGDPRGPDSVLLTNYRMMALSPSGHGLLMVSSEYSTMPTAAAPNGDSGAISNPWALYFK